MISHRNLFFLFPAEPTEQREQNGACISYAESRRRKTKAKWQKWQKFKVESVRENGNLNTDSSD